MEQNSEYIVIPKKDIEEFVEFAKEKMNGLDLKIIEAFAQWMYQHDILKDNSNND